MQTDTTTLVHSRSEVSAQIGALSNAPRLALFRQNGTRQNDSPLGSKWKPNGSQFGAFFETEPAKNLTRKQLARWHRPCRFKYERRKARMKRQWLAMEHYRLHVIEAWPESRAKEAALASARSCIEGLIRDMPPTALGQCDICAARDQALLLAAPLRWAA